MYFRTAWVVALLVEIFRVRCSLDGNLSDLSTNLKRAHSEEMISNKRVTMLDTTFQSGRKCYRNQYFGVKSCLCRKLEDFLANKENHTFHHRFCPKHDIQSCYILKRWNIRDLPADSFFFLSYQQIFIYCFIIYCYNMLLNTI